MTGTSAGWVDGATVEQIAERLHSAGHRVEIVGDGARVVRGITHDSRRVDAGNVFACFRGGHSDGHDHAPDAVASGAGALLVDHVLDGVGDVPQLVVGDTRVAAGPASAIAWGDPDAKLVTIGITGTNGKTTTAQMVAAMFEAAGVSCGVIGTLHGPRTTPEAPDLHRMLREFVEAGHRAVVMEVSSHALELHRVDGTAFDVVAFTNFGHDHLDLHGSPEAYFRAKARLFSSTFASVAVVNVDDVHGRLIADTARTDTTPGRSGAPIRVVEVSRAEARDAVVGSDRHEYSWHDRPVVVGVGGDFNVDNSLIALRIVEQSLVADIDRAIAGLASMGAVPGRFEIVAHPVAAARGITVVVDYAHTPDGLSVVLESARRITDARVISVFGCAGRRDREKRPVMGEVAARLSDVAVATSDNPRGEDPDDILDDVLAGVAEQYRSRVTRQPDRRLAIRAALATAERNDIVVIAGKGHETSQDLGPTVVEFDDRLVAREELSNAQDAS
ncbi:MAG: UDP-N-acetylmuramoyl-L-alanyl-D-glutamate--2,6-diaminopimelate ligase [Ilumatobacter sp.]